MRNIGQWLGLLAIGTVCGSIVASCGGSADHGFSVFDASTGSGDASIGTGDDGSMTSTGDDGSSSFLGDVNITCTSQQQCTPGKCGLNDDGCGNFMDCGACSTGQFCGGGGYNICGNLLPDGGTPCSPMTCASQGFNCGPAGDGCGGSLDCGTCTAPATCGGAGPFQCGVLGVPADAGDAGAPAPCTPMTCASQGFNCGPAGDGCGGSLDCGTCSGRDICGGGGQPGVCGSATPCTGLCLNEVACDGGQATTVTGTVLAGDASAWTGLPPDPVPNVLVYVPNASVQPFTKGAACRQCGADVSGSPLVSTYTNFDGTFTLQNVPTGTNVPLVIQLGRWRRQVTIPTVTGCTNTVVTGLNLPRTQVEGDIPLTAVSTGNVDALECVLLKMGVAVSEFTPDSGPGRIHLYGGGPTMGNPAFGPGSTAPAGDAGLPDGGPPQGTRQEAALLDANGTFMNYDQIMLPCWGSPITKDAAELANLVSYADNGGHFFATHYSYSWLVGNGEFNSVAQWNPNFDNPGTGPWTLNVSAAVPPAPPAPNAGTFAKWLNLVGALSNASDAGVPATPQVSITNPRHDADGLVVDAGSVDWIDGLDQRMNDRTFNGFNTPLVEHFTFNTPVGAASQCGHAIFSDFHVAGIANGANTNGQVFPNECTHTFTPQEKILEFMIWDLASCVPPPPPPTCTPLTCMQQNISCGPAGDGCGNSIAGGCGICPPGEQCGGNGVYGQCVPIPDSGSCQPQTCAQLGLQCGPAGDGCGGSQDCGPCTPPQTCGGGGTPGQCGGGCVPLTCAQQNKDCGSTSDGCGNIIVCGPPCGAQ